MVSSSFYLIKKKNHFLFFLKKNLVHTVKSYLFINVYLFTAQKLMCTHRLCSVVLLAQAGPVVSHVRPDHNRSLCSAECGSSPCHRKQSIRPIHMSQQLLDPTPFKSHQPWK